MPARLPAGERVAEFVHKNDARRARGIRRPRRSASDTPFGRVNLINRDDEPGEMQIDLDPRELEKRIDPLCMIGVKVGWLQLSATGNIRRRAVADAPRDCREAVSRADGYSVTSVRPHAVAGAGASASWRIRRSRGA